MASKFTSQEERFLSTLLHHVLGWTVTQALDEKLHEGKVGRISETFASKDEYLNALHWPFLEEIRGQVCQGLESIQSGERVQVQVQVHELKSWSEDCSGASNTMKLCFEMLPLAPEKDSDEEKNESLRYENVASRDVVFLTECKPERLRDKRTHKAMGLHSLGIAHAPGDGKFTFVVDLLLPSHRTREWTSSLGNVKHHRRCWVFKLSNLITGVRIWIAMQTLKASPATVPIVEEALKGRFEESITSSFQALLKSDYTELKEAMQAFCKEERSLNKSQVVALVDSVMALLQKSSPLVQLIQGPPGTGKTSMLVSLLIVLGNLNFRVQMCAPTNTAVREVATRFLRHMFTFDHASGDGNNQFGAWRRAAGLQVGGKSVSVLYLGDLLLVGNPQRIESVQDMPEFENMVLANRVKRLAGAFSSVAGYKQLAASFDAFLKDPVGKYHERLKSITDNQIECSHDGSSSESDQEVVELPTIAKYVRLVMDELAQPLAEKSSILCTDVPSALIKPGTRQQLCTVSRLVEVVIGQIEEANDVELESWVQTRRPYYSVDDNDRISDWVTKKPRSALPPFFEAREALIHTLASRPGYDLKMTGSADVCLRHARITFSTVSSSVGATGTFDCAIIDEASQLVEAETLVVTHRHLQQLILVGDHKQLPATVISKVAQSSGYDRSLFDRLQSLEYPSKMLNMQYRMHPEISKFSIEKFYDGRVENGANVKSIQYSNKPYQNTVFKRYSFIDIDGHEESGPGGQGCINPAEMEAVKYLVSKLHSGLQRTKTTATVGIVSPYKAQVHALTEWLQQNTARFPNAEIQVKTVDGFQGRETDIIIFSAVRANTNGKVGFLNDNRRLNVAITRARYCMWIVGNEATLHSDQVWKLLIADAKKRKCLLHQSKDEGLAEAVKQAVRSTTNTTTNNLCAHFSNLRFKASSQNKHGHRNPRK